MYAQVYGEFERKIPYDEWSNPYIKACKTRGIKFTRKNNEKLRDAWLGHLYRGSGINGVFWGIYGDNVQRLVQRDCILLNILSDPSWLGSELPKPTKTSRYFTWNPINEYGFIEYEPDLDKLPILWYSNIYGKEEQNSFCDWANRNSNWKSTRRARDKRNQAYTNIFNRSS